VQGRRAAAVEEGFGAAEEAERVIPGEAGDGAGQRRPHVSRDAARARREDLGQPQARARRLGGAARVSARGVQRPDGARRGFEELRAVLRRAARDLDRHLVDRAQQCGVADRARQGRRAAEGFERD
jgi:hypothetical protein